MQIVNTSGGLEIQLVDGHCVKVWICSILLGNPLYFSNVCGPLHMVEDRLYIFYILR